MFSKRKSDSAIQDSGMPFNTKAEDVSQILEREIEKFRNRIDQSDGNTRAIILPIHMMTRSTYERVLDIVVELKTANYLAIGLAIVTLLAAPFIDKYLMSFFNSGH